jgi:hypothetical protein
MRGVATLRNKQYGKYELSAINNSAESIKNREYFPEFEAKFEKPLDAGAWKKHIHKNSETKNLVGLPLY